MLEHSPYYVQYQIQKIPNGLEKKWFKSWCHSERSLYKNLIWSLSRQPSSECPTVFLVLFTKYSRLETQLSLGKLRSLCWYRPVGGQFAVGSHWADWLFASPGRERRTKYFSYFLDVLTGRRWAGDVYRPRQSDKLLEEKAQRRIINRWLSLIRNRCL